MNKLPLHKRVMILSMLVEGMSMRSISRTVGVSINTVTKMLVDAGEACAAYHDETVRNVRAQRVQCDEIWSFCYAKAKNVETAKAAPEGAGDVWTWTALDSDSKIRWRRCLIARGSRQRKERNRDRYRAKRIRNFGKKGATKTWKKTRSTRERRRWKRRG